MPAKLSTTVGSISSIPNPVNSTLVHDFYQYMKSIGTSENYQNVNLKIMIYFGRFLGSTTDFYSIQKKDQILAFLDTRVKDIEIDADKRWIRTWNDYLQRLKYFFRWFYNKREREIKELDIIIEFIIPLFTAIRKRLDICVDYTTPSLQFATEPVWKAYLGTSERGIRIR
jgi:integrase/recombinase XerD